MVVVAALVAACGDDDTDVAGPTESGTTPTTPAATSVGDRPADDDRSDAGDARVDIESTEPTDVIDITDAVLTATSPDCADYDASLTASVTDIQRHLMFESGVVITAGATTCTLTSNNIPNHDFDDESASFAHDVAEVERVFELIRDPQVAASSTPLSQRSYDAVLLNGVPVDLLSAGCYRPDDPMANAEGIVPIGCGDDDPWLADPLGAAGKFGVDEHHAHTQPDGGYHYHGDPVALYDDHPGPDGSPVIGFAADGFPIYGPYIVDQDTGELRRAVSGYELKQGERPAGAGNPPGAYDGTYYNDYEYTGAGDLDECNGMEVDGRYAYHLTETFPYLLFCHAGTPDESFRK